MYKNLMLEGLKRTVAGGGVFFLGLAALFSAECLLNLELRKSDAAWVDTGEVTGRKWDPRLMRIISFGHLPALVDWLWLKVLMDPATFHVAPGTHAKVYYDLDLITDLDPAFYVGYHAGANFLAVIRNDGTGARDLLVKARKFMDGELLAYPDSFKERYWPYSWAISLSLAYVYLFELGDLPNAAVEFQNASKSPNSPPYLKSLAERFQTPGGEYEVGLRLLSYLANSTGDPRMAERFKAQRQSLLVAQYVYEVNERYRKFIEAHGRGRQGGAQWENFLRKEGISGRDPWGGVLRLGEGGRVGTTTPYEKVLGLG